MRKAVFFDIDGTIISDDGKSYIPESTKTAIKALRKQGNLSFINTGRTIMNVDEEIRFLGFDGYVCGCGTYILFDNRVILKRTVSQNICEKTVKIIRECDFVPLYERFDGFFSDPLCRMLPEPKALFDKFKNQGKDTSKTTQSPDFGFDKFVAWYDENSRLDAFKKAIDNDFDYIDRGWGFCEIVPKGFSKGNGIKSICEILGIDIKDTYAIGDSLNDAPMLEAAGTAIAMGNSHKDLIMYADFVTKRLEDDGIEYALKHFDLC